VTITQTRNIQLITITVGTVSTQTIDGFFLPSHLHSATVLPADSEHVKS